MIKSLFHKTKKNPLLFFLLKLVLFLLIIFVLDYSIGKTLRYFYFKQESGLQYRTTYSIEKTTANLLVFGSSRANHHYDPAIFEKQFHLSYYNTGRDGTSILYHTAVLNAVFKRYVPKIVILDFMDKEFQKNKDSYDRLAALLPYYKTHPEMRSIIELKSKFEKLKLISSIYPYNSSMFTIAIGNTELNKKRNNDIQGYVPLTKTWSGPIHPVNNPAIYEIDSTKIRAYKTFIQKCAREKVKLYIACSPYFTKSSYVDYSLRIAKEIAKENNVDFFDYSGDARFINNTKLFADNEHLNEQGARLFSNRVADDMSKANESEPGKVAITTGYK